MFFLHARFPLRLACESWDGAPNADLAGFCAALDKDRDELETLVVVMFD
jgi:hypothetical protein